MAAFQEEEYRRLLLGKFRNFLDAPDSDKAEELAEALSDLDHCRRMDRSSFDRARTIHKAKQQDKQSPSYDELKRLREEHFNKEE